MMNKPSVSDVAKQAPEASNLKEIGSGGYKVVYQADIGGSTEALIVVQIPTDASDPAVREANMRRAEREIRILKDCKTPCLVRLGSLAPRCVPIGAEEYLLYSEELVPGVSLRGLLNASHKWSVKELASVAMCLLQAIGELSTMGVIHRDIKPDNIMQTSIPGRPHILLDLGIAFHVGGTPITRDASHVPGTLYYIAPEMLDADFRQNLDYRADLYTMGLTLYELASGINPFRSSGPDFTTLYRIKTLTPSPLASHRPDLPTDFCNLVDQLMKKLPALRPSNITALLARVGVFQ